MALGLIVCLVPTGDVPTPARGRVVPSAATLPDASATVPAPSPTSAPDVLPSATTLPDASATVPAPSTTSAPEVSPSGSTVAPASASALLERLIVAPEHREGYDRDLFPHWIDEDGDGCNTREEVLITEAVTVPAISSDCHLAGGSWLGPYDGLVLSGPAEVQIDHFVPLAEAWYSGAWAWSTERRQALANDIGLPWTLVGVSGQSNQSKGSDDPAEWLPPLPSAVCPYVEAGSRSRCGGA